MINFGCSSQLVRSPRLFLKIKIHCKNGGGGSSIGTSVTYEQAIAFLYFGNIDFSQFTDDDPPGNALSRFRERSANWVQDNIREPLSGWFDNNTRNIFTLDAEGQAIMDDMRSQMSAHMQSSVGGAIRSGAQYCIVGSGMGTGHVGAFIKRWNTTSDNNFVGKLATRLGRIVKAVDQPYKFEGGVGDVDIVTSLYNIEVKSGNKMKITQSIKNLNYANSLDKKYILYMPNATDRQIFDASKKGITVVKSENVLKNLIKR